MPKLTILLPAARRSSRADAQTCWGDLRVALASIAAYAAGVDVVVGWSGLEKPAHLPENSHMRLIEQPEGISTGSDAWNWCATQTDAEHLLILGDDCVLHPDSVRLLLEDMLWLRSNLLDAKIGFVGARSNYVKGPQNIRASNGSAELGIQLDSEASVLPAHMVVPVAALVRHDVFDLTNGFPSTNWFADDLMCHDLTLLGYSHYISRSYVHHVGQRSTVQGKSLDHLLAEGLSWLERNRPDFLSVVQGR